jgi:hypothetical protein
LAEKEGCKFTDDDVSALRSCFPAGAIFRPFDVSVKSDCVSTEWICFPAYPFQLGFSYPFPDFTRSFFEISGISYIQAMPMVWRTLFTIEEILVQEEIKLNTSDLSVMYQLTTHGSNRFILKSRSGQSCPVLKTTQNDYGWKNQFFFVGRSSIPGGEQLPHRWVLTGRGLEP